MTSSTITIGVPVETGTAAAAQAFAISGAGSVSVEHMVEAVLDDINERGGVLGRKVRAAFHHFDVATAIANPNQTAAAICADYADDRPVFAVMFNFPDPGLRRCLAEMGSPLLMTASIGSILPSATYDQYGGSYLYGVNSITTERLAELFIESLQVRSFHKGWNTTTGGPGPGAAKLGVIHEDSPDINALYDAYARELAKYGHRFAETVTYPHDVNQAFAATQSAVLRFKAARVTHVYGASVPFMQAAEAQRYRPRYAYLPGLGAFGATNAPAVQMRGALTVGWAPANDVNEAQDPGPTQGAQRCRTVMRAAGINPTNRNDLESTFNVCDGLYSFRDALAAGRAPTVPALRTGFESMGTRFATALTFRARLGPSRHNGVDSVRDMAYDSDCRCLIYTSKTDRS